MTSKLKKTLLQHMADEMSKYETSLSKSDMSIAVMQTPICHPELAGEGIEYA